MLIGYFFTNEEDEEKFSYNDCRIEDGEFI